MNGNNSTLKRVSLAKVIRKGFRDAYDHLGYVVLVTMVAFAATVVIASMASLGFHTSGVPNVLRITLMLPAVLVSFICALGVFYYVNKSVFGDHPAFIDTFVGIKRLLVPGLKLFLVDMIITAVLVGDTVFFLMMFSSKSNLVSAVFAILFGYGTAVWLMMAMYHLPILVAQVDMESGPGVRVVIRKSFLLMADNPGFTVGLFLVIIAFAVLCTATALIGIAALFLGTTAFLLTHALRELFAKYGVVEEEPEVVEDEGWPRE